MFLSCSSSYSNYIVFLSSIFMISNILKALKSRYGSLKEPHAALVPLVADPRARYIAVLCTQIQAWQISETGVLAFSE